MKNSLSMFKAKSLIVVLLVLFSLKVSAQSDVDGDGIIDTLEQVAVACVDIDEPLFSASEGLLSIAGSDPI